MNYITPRLWIAKGDTLADCNVGVELTDLALQYGFFPQLIEELRDVLFMEKTIEGFRTTAFW